MRTHLVLRRRQPAARATLAMAFFALLVALVAVFALPASASPRRMNGMLAFARYNPAIDDTQAYIINPDGTGERFVQGPTDHGEGPAWFPDGIHIATGGASDLAGGGSRIINVDDGTWRDVDGQIAGLFNPCGTPSPDGTLLLCETFSDDGSQNGIHTIRSSDGGGFTQITSNPGGDDVPGSWSPNGMRIVFQRFGPDSYEGVFVVNLNGTGLKRILPPTVSANCCTFNWSPQGNEIAFSRHVTPDVHSSLWVVHSDGSGLRPLPVPPGSGCGGSNDDPAAIGCLEPAWSPDGTKIAFAGGLDLDTDGEIYTMNLDGTGFTQVTHTGGSQSPNWGTHPLTG
jgi:Tol biopolymer transport system component